MTVLPSTIIEFNLTDHTFKKITLDELNLASNELNKVYWIHVNLEEIGSLQKFVAKVTLPTQIHVWCRAADAFPKLVDNDEEVSILIEGIASTDATAAQDENYDNLIIFLSERFCFTAAHTSFPALTALLENLPKAIKHAKTSCFLLFLLFDEVINDYAKVLLNFELQAEEYDINIRQFQHNAYNDVMDAKKQLMRTKRNAIAIRDILMQISGRKITVISEDCRISLGHLFSHMQVVVNEADAIHDLQNGMLDQIHNALIQKMNETMMVLTAFAAIFLPLTFIAGVYGMNFQWMPELQWSYGYFWALGLMLFCGLGLLWIFKKRKWF